MLTWDNYGDNNLKKCNTDTLRLFKEESD